MVKEGSHACIAGMLNSEVFSLHICVLGALKAISYNRYYVKPMQDVTLGHGSQLGNQIALVLIPSKVKAFLGKYTREPILFEVCLVCKQRNLMETALRLSAEYFYLSNSFGLARI